MYTVIIADDEPWILFKIKSVFKWQEYGMELIGETTSSDELLSMIEEKKPDIVFTDINMPGKSGIEVVKRVREKAADTLFVLISGYSDFSYAQQAIEYGVFSYLLKPVTEDKARSLLEGIKSALDKKHGDTVDIKIDNAKNMAFKKLISYIDAHYCEKLHLGELSAMFDINTTYCCALFNKNFNCTFSQYILKCRMERAAELILSGKSTTETAELLGYDYYHFNKLFKKYFSLTPKQYKVLKS